MLSCANPSCLTPFDAIIGVNPNEKPVPGSIILCPECGHISVVEAYVKQAPVREKGYATRLITNEEYASLHDADKLDLDFAVRVIQAQHAKKNTQLILPEYFKRDA